MPSSPLTSASVEFFESLYEDYRHDPSSVDTSWRVVFGLVDELCGETRSKRPAEEGYDPLAELVRARGHTIASLDPLGLASPTTLADLCASQGDGPLTALTGGPPTSIEIPAPILRLRDL